jgi:hypothetical protein
LSNEPVAKAKGAFESLGLSLLLQMTGWSTLFLANTESAA